MERSVSKKTRVLNILRRTFLFYPFEKVLLLFTVGKQFGSFFSRIPPNHYMYCQKTLRVANRNGIAYKLDISDMVDWYIYYGFIEKSRRTLYRNIKKGNTVFDIGANVGEVSMNAAKITGDSGKVYAFEPNTINYNRLNDNLKLNSYKNIKIIKAGLGDVTDEKEIVIIDDKNKGMTRIMSDGSVKSGISEKITILTLDSFVSDNNIEHIDFIKIDVEGYEMKVLKGAIESIRKFRPGLFIEIDDNNLKQQGSCAKEVVELLHKEGYTVKYAETLMNVNSTQVFKDCHFDVVCEILL